MATNSQPSRPLRVGDRERERVVATLQRALADGLLSLSELDDRLTRALQARTRADLEPLVEDLGPPLLASSTGEMAALPVRRAAPGYSQADPLQDTHRRGVWTVPPFLRVDQASRWLTLDFQTAVLDPSDTEFVDVELVGGAGWVLLVVPVGWAVDVARLSVGWGSTSIKVPESPSSDAPLLALRGPVGAGRLWIRNPAPRDRRRATRYLRRHRSLHQLGST